MKREELLGLLAAVLALGLLVMVLHVVSVSDSPIKDAAAAFDAAKADETTHSDWIAYPNGNLVPFDQVALGSLAFTQVKDKDGFVVLKSNHPKTVTKLSVDVASDRGVVKHVVCETYYDAPKFVGKTGDDKYLNGGDNLARATVYVTRCRFIVTSLEAAYHRLTDWATPSYKVALGRASENNQP